MDRKSILMEDIDILQRKLTGLKDSIHRRPISSGQERFLMTYIEVISDYANKSLDILDEKKYREELKLIED